MSDEIEKLRAHVRVLNESLLKNYGTIAALETAIYALVRSHHNHDALHKELAGSLEQVEALFLGGSASEAALAAFQEVRKRLDDSLLQQFDTQPAHKQK